MMYVKFTLELRPLFSLYITATLCYNPRTSERERLKEREIIQPLYLFTEYDKNTSFITTGHQR